MGDRSIRIDPNQNITTPRSIHPKAGFDNNNHYANEIITNRSRLNTEQGDISRDFGNYPTWSILNADDSRMIKQNNNEVSPFKPHAISKTNIPTTRSNQSSHFEFGGGFYGGENKNLNNINNNNMNLNPKANVMWDFTQTNNIVGGNQPENRIASYNHGLPNNVDEKPCDIDFGQLLGTKATGIQSQMNQVNKPSHKVDPFEGFY